MLDWIRGKFSLTPDQQRKLHRNLVFFWGIMIIPTVLWWHDSILWVAGCSLYANMATHWGAMQGARAEVAAVDISADHADVTANTVEINEKRDTGNGKE